MAEKKNDKSEWDFKVSDEDLVNSEVKKKPRVVKASSSEGGTPEPNKEKKTVSRKAAQLKVEQVTKKTMTRAQIARRDEALKNYRERIPPSYINRVVSTVIDYGIVGAGWYGSKFFMKDLYREYVKLLTEKGIDQTLHPQVLELYISLAVTSVVAIILVIFPILLFKATPGKSMLGIHVGHKLEEETPSSFMVLLRETLFKPLSVASVIGLLLGFKNKGNRCLHDILSNTTLYVDPVIEKD